jgi:hypothetical protein
MVPSGYLTYRKSLVSGGLKLGKPSISMGHGFHGCVE